MGNDFEFIDLINISEQELLPYSGFICSSNVQ